MEKQTMNIKDHINVKTLAYEWNIITYIITGCMLKSTLLYASTVTIADWEGRLHILSILYVPQMFTRGFNVNKQW